MARFGAPAAVRLTMKRYCGHKEEGQAMVEFVLVATLLLLILFGIIQYGIAFKNSIALTDAVRAGARKAAVSRTSSDPVGATRQAVLTAANDLNTDDVQVYVTPDPNPSWSAGSNVTVRATYPYQIDILGIVVASGDLHSETTERVE
ncbi:MAG TPA: TadE family protein [Gaiellaceae bacterium]|nr:TadE family protein [Gaiellaceae bacterium]